MSSLQNCHAPVDWRRVLKAYMEQVMTNDGTCLLGFTNHARATHVEALPQHEQDAINAIADEVEAESDRRKAGIA